MSCSNTLSAAPSPSSARGDVNLPPKGTPSLGRGAAQLRLHSQRPIVPALALLMAALVATMLEIGARIPGVQERLGVPSYGIANPQFEVQWDRLARFANQTGGVPCILLGSSEVYRGIDPELLQQVMRAATGRNLLCFNLGIRGLDPLSGADVLQIVIDRYHPALVIYGLDVPSFTTSRVPGIRGDLEQNAWIQYMMGEPNLKGWLIDHSCALRDYLIIRNWPRGNFWDQLAQERQLEAGVDSLGFAPLDQTANGLNAPPSAAEKAATLSGALSDFVIDPEQVRAFERLLTAHQGIQVLVVEMPLHPGFIQFFGNGWSDYERGLQAAQEVAQRHHVILISTTRLNLIPDLGWASSNHLNRTGAALFTRWLATTLSQLVQEGQIVLPATGTGGNP